MRDYHFIAKDFHFLMSFFSNYLYAPSPGGLAAPSVVVIEHHCEREGGSNAPLRAQPFVQLHRKPHVVGSERHESQWSCVSGYGRNCAVKKAVGIEVGPSGTAAKNGAIGDPLAATLHCAFSSAAAYATVPCFMSC
ncbi:hypothetical protein RB195_012319 [Necator americanus]|uniref:Uncharacterized protein n=1 Tax=Necator americanus TaxID=51031 RepID=A0ABR1D6I5_NECAM